MRVLGKALPQGGTRYATLGGTFDIVRSETGGWFLCHDGQRVLQRQNRRSCLRYLDQWLGDEHGFAYRA